MLERLSSTMLGACCEFLDMRSVLAVRVTSTGVRTTLNQAAYFWSREFRHLVAAQCRGCCARHSLFDFQWSVCQLLDRASRRRFRMHAALTSEFETVRWYLSSWKHQALLILVDSTRVELVALGMVLVLCCLQIHLHSPAGFLIKCIAVDAVLVLSVRAGFQLLPADHCICRMRKIHQRHLLEFFQSDLYYSVAVPLTTLMIQDSLAEIFESRLGLFAGILFFMVVAALWRFEDAIVSAIVGLVLYLFIILCSRYGALVAEIPLQWDSRRRSIRAVETDCRKQVNVILKKMLAESNTYRVLRQRLLRRNHHKKDDLRCPRSSNSRE